MTEKYRYQNELAGRASDSLPFVDRRAVKQASSMIMTEAMRLKNRGGDVLYPFALSQREERAVLDRLDHTLRTRVLFVPGFRTRQGFGTLILINGRDK